MKYIFGLQKFNNLLCCIFEVYIIIPLSDDDKIEFAPNNNDLPHLLGIQYWVNIPELEKYANKEISASYAYLMLEDKNIIEGDLGNRDCFN